MRQIVTPQDVTWKSSSAIVVVNVGIDRQTTVGTRRSRGRPGNFRARSCVVTTGALRHEPQPVHRSENGEEKKEKPHG